METTIHNNDSLQIHNSQVSGNDSGMIIFNDGERSNAGLFNVKFTQNSTNIGIIFNRGKYAVVEKCIFNDNRIIRDIYNLSDMTLDDVKIDDGNRTIENEGFILLKSDLHNVRDKIYG